MVDINFDAGPAAPNEEELRQAIELLYFAYREFTAEPDAILAAYGYGRAHHRVIYFVGRQPGISVTDLLATLRVTKQGLSRVLGQLIADGMVIQRPGERDRRLRLLSLTSKGLELERELTENQRARFARAHDEAGAEAFEGFRKIMRSLMRPSARQETPPKRGKPPTDR